MSINIKQKFIEMLPASSAPEGFVNFLNNLNDNDYIIHITSQSSSEHELIQEINQMIDDIYLTFLRVNNLTELERKNIERTISNLRDFIIKTISSFKEQFPGQPERSVYGSKRMKNGYFTLTRYFSYTEIHLRPSYG